MQRSLHHALDRDAIFRALSSFYGITTADGNVTTLICSALIGSNDFITDKTILLDSGASIFEDAGATVFDPGTGTIIVNPAFSSPVLAGTGFYVLNASSAALAIALNGVNQGLIYRATVTDVPNATTFRAAELIGYGSTYFRNWYIYVVWDSLGLGNAPQDEYTPATAFNSADATFTHAAFTAQLAVGDRVLLLHPWLASLMRLRGVTPVSGNVVANWQAAEVDLVLIGTAGINNKLHTLNVGITNLIGNVSIRMYTLVNGVEGRFYPIPAAMTFSAAGDAPVIPVVAGTLGLYDALRVTVQSDNAADNGQAVDYTYMMEEM
jgi:hypothetical protein